jgi:long-chain acyl-CoA synthetase
MLDPKEYIADWPDMPYAHLSAWLSGIAEQWGEKTAVYYRSGKQKDFIRWSFNYLAQESRRIGRGLLARGLIKGDRVVLWAENCPEWMASYLGAAIAGLVIVPVDFQASEGECFNILHICKAKAFFYSKRKEGFVREAAQVETLTTFVCFSNNGEQSYLAFGLDAEQQRLPNQREIAPRDPASIVFTSGTTGFAKGVVLHHKGIIANANAAVRSLRALPSDIFVNTLPLHHPYPAACSFISPLSCGAATIIAERFAVQAVVDDIHDAGGTFLIAVPLFYDKLMKTVEHLYQRIPSLARTVLDALRERALNEADKGNPLFGRRVFRFIRRKARLGSIRIMVSGGAPLNRETADFFDSFGFNLVQGYGMSENGPLISVNTPKHKRNDSVGLPVKYTEIKILDRNEEGIGEIAAKSPSLMLGYYENPEATAGIFTGDGFLKTGDLGFQDEDGFIYISGRKKNLIISSGGKHIYPEEIERCFAGSSVISEILIVGRKEQGGERIAAVAVPNMKALAGEYPNEELSDEFLSEVMQKEVDIVNRSLVSHKKIAELVLRREAFEKNAQQKIRRFLYKRYERP